MKLLLILISILLLSSPVIGQSSKPLGVVLPPTVMGNVSNSRKQILLNTLDDELSQYFDVSPPTNVSSGDLPVVEDVFQLQIVEDDGDTQLSVRWMSGNERKIETILCGGCKTIELNGKLKELVGKFFDGKNIEPVVYKEEIKNREPIVQRTVNYSDGSKYVGEFKDGKFHGQGTYTYLNGDKYVGEFKDGKPNGQGTRTSPDGSKYVGEYKDGVMNGQGTFTLPNGFRFVGEIKKGVPLNGTFYDKNGNIEQKFVNGKEKGKGNKIKEILYLGFRSGKIGYYTDKWEREESKGNKDFGKYEGEIKNGKPHGQGTETFYNGNKYVGEFKDGSPNGQGTETFYNGNKYVGEYKDGEYDGQGTYTFSDGRKYIGEWKDDKRNGHGTETFYNGNKYVGSWKDEKFHGQGTYTWSNGDVYEGEFKNGKFNGQGTETYTDGQKYEGGYKNGKPHGQGTRTSPDGSKYVGEFKDGEYNQGTYSLPNGQKYVGEFKDGKPWKGKQYDKDGNIRVKYVNGVKQK